MGLLVRYVLFAIVSTIVNLATQEIAFRLAPVRPLTVSILAGTATGFIVKYILDKKWIFYDDYTSHRHELRKVALYGLFSVMTTLIFWGLEIAFWSAWQTSAAKYTGAVLGLSVGYTAKYMLDRKFVFRERGA
jgi:putative flippase GtrA